jgi:hypothetical protein
VCAVQTNSRVLGAVTAADFEGMMRDYFHAKPEDQIMEMLATAEQDLLMKAPTQWEQKVRTITQSDNARLCYRPSQSGGERERERESPGGGATAHRVLTSHNKPVPTTPYRPAGGTATSHSVLTCPNTHPGGGVRAVV